jgi:hypothetical protein
LNRKRQKEKTVETSIPEYCRVGGCGSRLGDTSRWPEASQWYQIRRFSANEDWCTTAPIIKPSAQTRFILEAMANREKEALDRWEAMMMKVDRLTEVQERLVMQTELSATMAKRAMEKRVRLAQQLEQVEKEVAGFRLKQLAREMEHGNHGQNRKDDVQQEAEPSHMYRDQFYQRSREETNRRSEEREFQQAPLPRMGFPRLEGGEPKIWLKKCVDYFHLYHVPETVWVMSASLHMEENAARWFQVYTLWNGLSSWEEFAQAVLQKFGTGDYFQAMDNLLELRQKGTVDEYLKEFEVIRYAAAIRNPQLDETMFVAHFIKGLKQELQGHVQSRVPATVDRAAFLARIQQNVLENQRQKYLKFGGQGKINNPAVRQENKAVLAGQDLSKEKLVGEYRRKNGLCFTCGDKFEPRHQNKCPKKVQMQLNVLSIDELKMTLTDEVLDRLEQEELVAEECFKLSLHAISGTMAEDCMGVRALLQNQVLLILVDSGSSASFISQAMVDRVGLPTQQCSLAKVKVANGEILKSDRVVKRWNGGLMATPIEMT